MAGETPEGFDFSRHMRRLCCDVTVRVSSLAHVDMDRVLVGYTQARNASRTGTFATLAPLRFAGGSPTVVRRGVQWRMPSVMDASGQEMLYVLSFVLPRFLDLPLREKLHTTVHELWHIGPAFDGDVRRLRGRCYAHGGSRKRFDEHAEGLTEQYLSCGPSEHVWGFLRHDFRSLSAMHGSVFGTRIRPLRLIRVQE